MDPIFLRSLVPLAGMLMVTVLASIPLLAIAVRFAAKPFVETLMQYKQAQLRGQASEDTILLQERRIALLEAELQQVQHSLQRVVEGEEFRRQLEAGR